MSNDLTWQQLSNKCPANAIVVANGTVKIDVSLLTGDPIESLSDSGVVEAISKLLAFAEKAQSTINTGLVTPNRLNSFSSTFGNIDDSGDATTITITRFCISKAPIDSNSIIGTNN